MLVEVTQEDIAMGQKANCTCCPIALAIDRIVTPNISVNVNQSRVWFSELVKDSDNWRVIPYHANLPEDAAQFILHFDSGHYVGPISFELDVQGATSHVN
jgi:hypothetical protein